MAAEIIDGDGHVYENDEEIFEHLEPPFRGKRTVLGFPLWPSIDGFHRGAIHAHMGLHKSFDSNAAMWLEFLDRTGIARTVLYPTAGLAHNLIRDPEWAVALARGYNDWLFARYVEQSPKLCGVALLPLQDPVAAAEELRRAVQDLGAVGAVLPAVGLRRPLGHADYDPIYAEAERLDCPLGIHGGPSQMLGLDGLDYFAQVHALAHPFSQMIQVTSVFMSGVFDRFPRVRIAFLEAGIGWVPFLAGRMDRSFLGRKRPEYVGGVKSLPSSYLRGGNVYFSIDPGEPALAPALEMLGEDTLFFASDFPHEVNAEGCRAEIDELMEALPAGHRKKVFTENPRRFYKLPD
jgi:predicted TIM-barrel fold metal-dependent hydrolase